MTAKILISFLMVTAFIGTSYGQSFISQTIQYDGETREYDIYIPASYTEATAVPLIFNFHGGGGDIASQIEIADMRPIADTAGFIVVYPQALPDPTDGGSTNWIRKDPTTFDDVFFIDALIDTLSTDYQIDASRIYACGYSLGGDFTYELGCRLNNKIAAIGVVARTMQNHTLDNCAPVHPTGVLTILGTADAVSDYNGLSWGGVQYYLSADESHDYWVNYNDCHTTPIVSTVPDINTSDGSTVERYSWFNILDCTYVEHLKVIGGGHDWPGSFGNMDINATEEIWNFVSQYDIDRFTSCITTVINTTNNSQIKYDAYPNPFNDKVTIEIERSETKEFEIYSILGELVLTGKVDANIKTIDLSSLAPNIYFFHIENQSIKLIKTD